MLEMRASPTHVRNFVEALRSNGVRAYTLSLNVHAYVLWLNKTHRVDPRTEPGWVGRNNLTPTVPPPGPLLILSTTCYVCILICRFFRILMCMHVVSAYNDVHLLPHARWFDPFAWLIFTIYAIDKWVMINQTARNGRSSLINELIDEDYLDFIIAMAIMPNNPL